jgi:hypothetical protein
MTARRPSNALAAPFFRFAESVIPDLIFDNAVPQNIAAVQQQISRQSGKGCVASAGADCALQRHRRAKRFHKSV